MQGHQRIQLRGMLDLGYSEHSPFIYSLPCIRSGPNSSSMSWLYLPCDSSCLIS